MSADCVNRLEINEEVEEQRRYSPLILRTSSRTRAGNAAHISRKMITFSWKTHIFQGKSKKIGNNLAKIKCLDDRNIYFC